jgi:hypothetical protein
MLPIGAWIAAFVLLGAMVPAYATTEPIAAPPAIPTVAASIEFPLTASVGPVRAGLLCMPNSKLHGRDFLRSQKDLALLIQRMLSERKADPFLAGINNFQINFQMLRVKLCARSWGVFGTGDTKALSGRAEFTFAWSIDRDAAAKKTISRFTIELDKAHAVPADEIMDAALNRLLDQIAQSSH